MHTPDGERWVTDETERRRTLGTLGGFVVLPETEPDPVVWERSARATGIEARTFDTTERILIEPKSSKGQARDKADGSAPRSDVRVVDDGYGPVALPTADAERIEERASRAISLVRA
jgi:hypothetical protein